MKKHPLRAVLPFAFILTLLAGSTASYGWGDEGHETVGAIADQILANTPAGRRVSQLLNGKTLEEVSTYPDKIRDGGRSPDPALNQFAATHPEKNPNPAYRHTSYHFTNIPIQENQYNPKSKGAAPYDVVNAIQNCVLILKGQPPKDAFFSGVTPSVALILLTHYVGDIHQPLHVGALFLDSKYAPINPDTAPLGAIVHSDRGGNLLLIPSPRNGYSGYRQYKKDDNLHHYWDTTLVEQAMADAGCSGNPSAFATYLRRRFAVLTPPHGEPAGWSEKWVKEILPLARKAHDNLVIVRTSYTVPNAWELKDLPSGYDQWAVPAVENQITRAGVHLAQILQKSL